RKKGENILHGSGSAAQTKRWARHSDFSVLVRARSCSISTSRLSRRAPGGRSRAEIQAPTCAQEASPFARATVSAGPNEDNIDARSGFISEYPLLLLERQRHGGGKLFDAFRTTRIDRCRPYR